MVTSRHSLTLALAAAFVSLALAGCSGSEDGTVSAYVQDAVTDDFSEVHLVVTGVAIHQSGDGSSGNSTGNTTQTGSSAGWKTLWSGSEDVDLLNATGTRAFFLGEEDFPAGKYQQMRITASSAYGIAKDGSRVDIALPNSELKVNKGFRVEAGKETQLVLDIDLERSLKETRGAWEFKPVVGKLYASIVDEDSHDHDAGEIATVTTSDSAAA